MKTKWIVIISAVLLSVLAGLYILYRGISLTSGRVRQVIAFIRQPELKESLIIPASTQCDDAPFILPTTGIIGFIWGDSFRIGHQHTGIDIFSGTEGGVTPIYAAYSGYLSRMADWKSSVIIRIPEDPFNLERQIWTYYTHMADSTGQSYIVEDFPPGTTEVFVQAGTLLGYMGNYSGNSGNPTGVHLHFSIVKDDGKGMFMNELEIKNTVDPSTYFGLPLNAAENKDEIPFCSDF